MGAKHIGHYLTLKQSYIIKHALRDKPDKDDAEQRVFDIVCENIEYFREKYRIPSPLPVKIKKRKA